MNVKHFLGIYQIRMRMQDEGLSDTSIEIKAFTREFVEKLSQMHLDEEIRYENYSFYDSLGNLIVTIPTKK